MGEQVRLRQRGQARHLATGSRGAQGRADGDLRYVDILSAIELNATGLKVLDHKIANHHDTVEVAVDPHVRAEPEYAVLDRHGVCSD